MLFRFPGKSHRQWSLAGYSPRGHKRAFLCHSSHLLYWPSPQIQTPAARPILSFVSLPFEHPSPAPYPQELGTFLSYFQACTSTCSLLPSPNTFVTAMNGSFPRTTAQPCHTLNSCPLPKPSLYHFISTRVDHSIPAFVWMTSVPTESHRDPRSPFRATRWGQSSQTMSFILSSLFPLPFTCLMPGLSFLNLRHNNGYGELIWSISLYICSTNPNGNSTVQKFNKLKEE